jgi:hypothetical protein
MNSLDPEMWVDLTRHEISFSFQGPCIEDPSPSMVDVIFYDEGLAKLRGDWWRL